VAAVVWAAVFAAMTITAARAWRRARHPHAPAARL
jgi:tryptophan-rich sensory protein